MQRTRRRGFGALALVAVASVITACAAPAGASNPPATTVPATGTPATAAPATNPPASAATAGTIALRTDAKYGAMVTDRNGMSLYVFLNDKLDGKSACYGDCAGTWPPLTIASASDLTAGTGVTGALGTITRTDGAIQVTLASAPLYYFAGDTTAGDTEGQGLFDKWYIVAPDGRVVKEVAEPGASTCTGPTCY
ncbi:MAG: hypothetical protein ABIZ52_03855 [Candidatus Limnocylindrales bacterium]